MTRLYFTIQMNRQLQNAPMQNQKNESDAIFRITKAFAHSLRGFASDKINFENGSAILIFCRRISFLQTASDILLH